MDNNYLTTYIPENRDIKKNNDYFNSIVKQKGGAKIKKEKEIDKLMSSKFKNDYFDKK